MKFEKIAFAASRVGSSLFAAGVPVLDRDRLVDFPKEPVSGTFLRDRVVNGLLSLLSSVSEYQSIMLRVCRMRCLTQERAWRRAFVCRPRPHIVLRLEHCVILEVAFWRVCGEARNGMQGMIPEDVVGDVCPSY